MDYETYYEAFAEYFAENFNSYNEIFEAGKKMQKALTDAMHRIAGEKWYGGHQVDKDSN